MSLQRRQIAYSSRNSDLLSHDRLLQPFSNYKTFSQQQGSVPTLVPELNFELAGAFNTKLVQKLTSWLSARTLKNCCFSLVNRDVSH